MDLFAMNPVSEQHLKHTKKKWNPNLHIQLHAICLSQVERTKKIPNFISAKRRCMGAKKKQKLLAYVHDLYILNDRHCIETTHLCEHQEKQN